MDDRHRHPHRHPLDQAAFRAAHEDLVPAGGWDCTLIARELLFHKSQSTGPGSGQVEMIAEPERGYCE